MQLNTDNRKEDSKTLKENLEQYRFNDSNLLEKMTLALQKTYYKDIDKQLFEQLEFKQDLEDHLFNRYHNTLFNYIPWISKYFDLKDKNIIEIGCGTGSSTAAFARFCGNVNAYEISSISLLAAKERMKIMGINNVQITEVTPDNILDTIKKDNAEGADVIILFAVLEHMKIKERLDTLKFTWNLLKPNGILVIAETPNRLTYYDTHTSWLPFFHMLPEDLAIEYYQKSPRNNFTNAISQAIEKKGIEEAKEKLIRWGNGVSFHEFEIAIQRDLDDLIINDGNAEEMRNIYPLTGTEKLLQNYFQQANINQPITFTQEILNFILQKKVESGQSQSLSSRGSIHTAWDLMKQGRQAEAFTEAKNISSEDSFFYDARVLCGEIKTSTKEYEIAEKYLNEAIEFNPNLPNAYMRRAWVRYFQQKPELAFKDIEKAENMIASSDNTRIQDWITTGINQVKNAVILELEKSTEKQENKSNINSSDQDAERLTSSKSTQSKNLSQLTFKL